MKKVFFLVVIIALTGISVLAQEQEQEQEQKPANRGPIDFHLTFFNFGLEMHIPWTFEGSLDLMVLGIEGKESGLGVEFSPAHLYGWVGVWAADYNPNMGNGKEPTHFEVGWSILNLTLFWNLMPLIAADVSYYLAPFVEFNYLVMSDTIHPEQLMLSVGLSVGRRRGDSIKHNSFSVEAGYRMLAHEMKTLGGTPNRMFIGIKFGR